MKKKFLLPSALLGAMLFVAPAMADPTAGTNLDLANPQDMGAGPQPVWYAVNADNPVSVVFDAATDRATVIVTNGTDTNGIADPLGPFGTPYIFNNLVIDATGPVAALGAQVNGFRFQHATDDFGGILNVNSIKVSSNIGDAYGVNLINEANLGYNSGADITGFVNIGSIEASTSGVNGGGAAGFAAGALGVNGMVTIGEVVVDVTAANGPATQYGVGVELMSGTDALSLLNVGSVNVTATGEATGIAVGSLDNSNAQGIVQVGEVNVHSNTYYAVGIDFRGNADDLRLTGDINVSEASGVWTAFGVNVGNDANITFENSLDITATTANPATGFAAGVNVENNATLNLANGAHVNIAAADSDGIIAGNDLTINLGNNAELRTNGTWVQAGNLTVAGNGFADLGALSMGGVVPTATIGTPGSTTVVAVDLADTFAGFLGGGSVPTVTVDDNSWVIGYGDIAPAIGGPYPIPGAAVAPAVAFAGLGATNFKNVAIFTDYRVEALAGGTGLRYYGLRTNAYMPDNYLAAAMIHNRYTGYNMVRDKFISGSARSGSGIFGQAPCDPCGPVCNPCDEAACNPCDPCGFSRGGSSTRNTWVNYVGRADSYGGWADGSGWDIGADGVQVGTDLFRTRKAQFGLIFGYEGGFANNSHALRLPNGYLVHNGVDRVTSDDTYLGFYAARVLSGGADVRFVYNHGWQDFDTVRTDPYTWGLARYEASFKGHTDEINMELGKRFHRGNWSYRPFGALDVYTIRLNGATETATGVNNWLLQNNDTRVRYDKLNLTQFYLRFGSDLRYQVRRFTLNSGLSYAYDMNGQKFRTRVYDADDATGSLQAWLQGSKLGRSVLMYNVGGEYQLGDCFSVFGGYDGQAVLDRAGNGVQHIGYVGGSLKW